MAGVAETASTRISCFRRAFNPVWLPGHLQWRSEAPQKAKAQVAPTMPVRRHQYGSCHHTHRSDQHPWSWDCSARPHEREAILQEYYFSPTYSPIGLSGSSTRRPRSVLDRALVLLPPSQQTLSFSQT
ncbi:hypothetical protein SRABI83_03844 [Arthrobacter sp. Bi83]|nr:hypothetical protein SRABI83_03844 [Arthrobacter sp. Bi83]